MNQLIQFVLANQEYAPWLTFLLILLAGLNIPISIDVLLVVSAFLAATTIPEYTLPLYCSILLGCYFSAWIAYWVGRVFGIKLLNTRWFSKVLSPDRLKKVGVFYKKHGFLTLIIGRFIPFGVRNCLFMTAGMSKMPFSKFIFRDAVACSLWASLCFYAFYSLGLNYEKLLRQMKIMNIGLFLAFSVTLIGVFCYKRYKKNRVK